MFNKKLNKTLKKYMTVDVARLGLDKTVIMIWDGLHVIKILYYPKTKMDDLKKMIVDLAMRENISMERIVIDEDGVGGGLVDNLRGCYGFVNNSRALPEKGLDTNYINLKSQCYYKLAEFINAGNIGVMCTKESVKEMLVQELEQIKRKDPDKDGKLSIIGKEVIKEQIGRSPDFADDLMMRMVFEISQGEYFLLDGEGIF